MIYDLKIWLAISEICNSQRDVNFNRYSLVLHKMQHL